MLSSLLIASAWIWGVHCFMDYSGLDEKITWRIKEKHLWVFKPLWSCPPCCSSIHGTFMFVWLGGHDIDKWIVFCFCLCGINFIIKKLVYD